MTDFRLLSIVFLFLSGTSMKAQINWTALNGPTGLNTISPSMSANGVIFLRLGNLNEFDMSFDDGDSWERHDLPGPTFPFNYKLLHQPNDQTCVLLSAKLYTFRKNTREWELLPGFDSCQNVWTDSQSRLWKLHPGGQLSFSTTEGASFTPVLTDVHQSFTLAMHNDEHNLMVVPESPNNLVYHFNAAGQKQLIPFNINNFYVDWIKYNPYSGVAFMKTSDLPNAIKKSTDGGLNWTNVVFPQDFPSTYVADLQFTQTGEVWAMSGAAAIVSSDNGANWTPFPPLDPEDLYYNGALIVSASGQKILYFISGCGQQVFNRSLNRGASWKDLSDAFKRPDITQIVKTDQGVLYGKACRRNNVEVSADEGQSWQTLHITTGNGVFTPVSICKAPDGTLYVPGDQVVYRSKNNGNSWETLDFDVYAMTPYVSLVAGYGGTVYAFNNQQKSAYSLDQGENWDEMMVPADFATSTFHGDHFDADGNFYRSGLYFVIKFEPGINFSYPLILPTGTYIEAFTMTSTGRILVAMTDFQLLTQKLYYSDDNGDQFHEIGPLPEWSSPARMISGPQGMVLLLLNGTYYRSLDNGFTWAPYFHETSLPGSISCLYFSPDNYLYAGLYANTIHRTAEKLVATYEPPSKLNALRVYPNPAAEFLALEIPVSGTLHYRITDALGRSVAGSATVVSTNGSAAIDIRSLIPGVYGIDVRDEHGHWIGSQVFCRR